MRAFCHRVITSAPDRVRLSVSTPVPSFTTIREMLFNNPDRMAATG